MDLNEISAAVYFPLISPNGTEVGQVNCRAVDAMRASGQTTFYLGQDDGLVRRIVANARYLEDDAEATSIPVRVITMPMDVHGESFGLALGIADKLCRYGDVKGSAPRNILATGVLQHEGYGKIGAVEGFAAKLECLDDERLREGIFVYPSDNEAQLTPAERQVMHEKAQRHKIELRSVGTLSDVKDLWGARALYTQDYQPIHGSVRVSQRPRSLRSLWFGVFAIFAISLLAATATGFVSRDVFQSKTKSELRETHLPHFSASEKGWVGTVLLSTLAVSPDVSESSLLCLVDNVGQESCLPAMADWPVIGRMTRWLWSCGSRVECRFDEIFFHDPVFKVRLYQVEFNPLVSRRLRAEGWCSVAGCTLDTYKIRVSSKEQ